MYVEAYFSNVACLVLEIMTDLKVIRNNSILKMIAKMQGPRSVQSLFVNKIHPT